MYQRQRLGTLRTIKVNIVLKQSCSTRTMAVGYRHSHVLDKAVCLRFNFALLVSYKDYDNASM